MSDCVGCLLLLSETLEYLLDKGDVDGAMLFLTFGEKHKLCAFYEMELDEKLAKHDLVRLIPEHDLWLEVYYGEKDFEEGKRWIPDPADFEPGTVPPPEPIPK